MKPTVSLRQLQILKEQKYVDDNIDTNTYCCESILECSNIHNTKILRKYLKEKYPNDSFYMFPKIKLKWNRNFGNIKWYKPIHFKIVYKFYTRRSFFKR